MKINAIDTQFHVYSPLKRVTYRLLACVLIWLGLHASPVLAATPMLAAGAYHTCALSGNGSVRCWGTDSGKVYYDDSSNSHYLNGQLGDDRYVDRASPVWSESISTAKLIASGGPRSCAVLNTGSVWCWGDLLGIDTHAFAAGAVRAVAVSSGIGCALLRDGSVQCWNYTQSGRSLPYPSVSSISTATAIAVGGGSGCAVLDNGHVWCWGENSYGRLGNGTTTDSSTPVEVIGISTAVAIAMSEIHSCALLNDGSVRCWGRNASGQLGDGSTTNSSVPVAVHQINSAVAIAAGGRHSCALLREGSIRCWGNNDASQLGNGNYVSSGTPVTVDGIDTATAITAGIMHSCALLANSNVQCWGYDGDGELGRGAVTPTRVSDMSSALAVSAGGGHSCAVLRNGSVQCWGLDYSDKRIQIDAHSSVPVTVGGISNAFAVSAGDRHSCAVLSTGHVACWGYNYYGELGDSTLTGSGSISPVLVGGIHTALAVATGNSHSCAVLSGGDVKCWGTHYGASADAVSDTDYNIPVAVSGVSGAIAVAVGDSHSCAVLGNGGIQCWGYNSSGQLGNGSKLDSKSVPVQVSGINNAISMSAYEDHNCAVLSNGEVRCWGSRWEGGLNLVGSLDYIGIPMKIEGIDTAIAVATGGTHSCALLRNGAVQCWGFNAYGQLGNGDLVYSFNPVTVSGISNATALAVGYDSSCALLSNGAVQCWGHNGVGQLGNGDAVNRPHAVVGVRSQGLLNLADAFSGSVDASDIVRSSTLIPSLEAQVIPASADQGRMGNVFIAVLVQDHVFMLTRSGFQPFDPGNPAAYSSGSLAAIRSTVATKLDVDIVKNASIYVGYGLGANSKEAFANMLAKGTFQMAYTK